MPAIGIFLMMDESGGDDSPFTGYDLATLGGAFITTLSGSDLEVQPGDGSGVLISSLTALATPAAAATPSDQNGTTVKLALQAQVVAALQNKDQTLIHPAVSTCVIVGANNVGGGAQRSVAIGQGMGGVGGMTDCVCIGYGATTSSPGGQVVIGDSQAFSVGEVAIGMTAGLSGAYSVLVGGNTLTTGTGIAIGYGATAYAANTCCIGVRSGTNYASTYILGGSPVSTVLPTINPAVLRIPDAVGTNVAGRTLTITAGTPNGTGAPGRVRMNSPLRPLHCADSAALNGSLYYSTTSGKLSAKDLSGNVKALY